MDLFKPRSRRRAGVLRPHAVLRDGVVHMRQIADGMAATRREPVGPLTRLRAVCLVLGNAPCRLGCTSRHRDHEAHFAGGRTLPPLLRRLRIPDAWLHPATIGRSVATVPASACSHPAIGARPPICICAAPGSPSSHSDSAGSTRISKPPWPLTADGPIAEDEECQAAQRLLLAHSSARELPTHPIGQVLVIGHGRTILRRWASFAPRTTGTARGRVSCLGVVGTASGLSNRPTLCVLRPAARGLP